MSEIEEVEEVEELQDYTFTVTLSLVASDGAEYEATYDTVISAETGMEAAISFARAFNKAELDELLNSNLTAIKWLLRPPAVGSPGLRMTGVSVVTDAEDPDDSEVKVEDLIG